jgi:hypothetical protein
LAAYTEYNPGPTISEQHNSYSALIAAFFDAAEPERVGVIGASASLTWYITDTTLTGGANPSINVTWSSTTGGHTATTFVRYDAVLLGGLDPAYVWKVLDLPANWLRAYSYSTIDTLATRLGSPTGIVNLMTSLSGPDWMGNLIGGGVMTGTGATGALYQDGSRAGRLHGCNLQFRYDPTAGEISAGIRQSHLGAFASVSDGDDGTINSGFTGGSIGEAIVNVPVPIVATPEAEESWLGWQNSQPTSNINVTHPDDLGGDTLSEEPDPGDAERFYNSAGAIPALLANEGLWGALTTLPSALLAFFIAGGRLAVALVTGGAVASLALLAAKLTDVVSGLGGIGTDVATIGTSSASLAAQLTGTATNISAIDSRLQSIELGAIDTIATAVEDNLPELAGIKDQVQAVKGSIDALKTEGAGNDLIEALQGQETALAQIPDAITSLMVASVENDLVTAIGAQATATVSAASSIATATTAIEALSANFNPATDATFAKRVVEALESIADSLKASPGATPPAKKLVEQLSAMASDLSDVANMQLSLKVQTQGTTFSATNGWDIP